VNLEATIQRWRREGPARFAVEALGVPEHYNLATGTGVLPWQWEASHLIVKKKKLGIKSGHGVGKSAFLSWCILWFMCCYFPCKIPCTANSASQLHDILWAELAKWHRKLSELYPALGDQFDPKKDSFVLKSHPMESFAVARTARKEKPEALQGFHSENILVVVDEGSGVDDVVFEVGEGTLTGPNSFVIIAGNPTRRNNFFFRIFNLFSDTWGTITVNAETVPMVTRESIERYARQYGIDSDQYRVRVLGEFPTVDSMQFIGEDLYDQAAGVEPSVYLTDAMVIGVDVARFGSDASVIYPRKGRDARTYPYIRLFKVDTMALAAKVAEVFVATKAEQIFVDAGGVGGGVVDRLNQMRLPVIGIDFGGNADRSLPGQDAILYANKVTEMWANLKTALQQGLALPKDDNIKLEMCGREYGYTLKKGRDHQILESKGDMRDRGLRSPDIIDALALTYAYPVFPSNLTGTANGTAKVLKDYDPYDNSVWDDANRVLAARADSEYYRHDA
jgi:hypothetical protein